MNAVPPDLEEIIARVERLREDTWNPAEREALLDEIENVLSEGYARALEGDAWSTQSENHLQELLCDPDAPLRGVSLRALSKQHGHFQRVLVQLRRELAELRRDRDRVLADTAVG